MQLSPQWIVYFVGVAALGVFYGPVEVALGGGWLFFAAVVVYLVALRVVGYFVARVVAARWGNDV